MNRPDLPTYQSHGPGDGKYIATVVACAICDAKSTYHSEVFADGSYSSDPWKTAQFIGYRLLDDGRIVCGEGCRKQAEHADSRFSVDASRHPTSERLNHGAPTLPLERTVRAVCSTCGGYHNAVQRRQTIESLTRQPSDRGKFTPWSPEPAPVLLALGWLQDGSAWFCGRGCHDRRAKASGPPVRAVLRHPDIAVQRRAPAPPPRPELIAQEAEPLPAPKPRKAGR